MDKQDGPVRVKRSGCGRWALMLNDKWLTDYGYKPTAVKVATTINAAIEAAYGQGYERGQGHANIDKIRIRRNAFDEAIAVVKRYSEQEHVFRLEQLKEQGDD